MYKQLTTFSKKKQQIFSIDNMYKNDMSINQRIIEIVNVMFAGNKRAFSIHVGVSAAVIENIVGKRQSNPSFEVTNKIILSIDNISADWLMIGKGDMLKVEINNTLYQSDNILLDMIQKKDEQIGDLKEEIGGLKNEIRNLTETIKKRGGDTPISLPILTKSQIENK